MELNRTQFLHKYGISYLIIVIQIMDMLMHLLTNQFEIIRVQSNIVIIVWIFFLFIPTHQLIRNAASTMSISIYLILNGVFLFQYGINNSTNDGIRIALFMFVILTTCFSFIQISQKR